MTGNCSLLLRGKLACFDHDKLSNWRLPDLKRILIVDALALIVPQDLEVCLQRGFAVEACVWAKR